MIKKLFGKRDLFGKGGAEFSQIRLLGDGEGGSSLVLAPFNFIKYDNIASYKWQVDDVDYLEPATTNICLQGRDLSSSSWICTGTKTIVTTVKSADGSRNVNCFNALNLAFYQDFTTLSGNYTVSFLIYSNHNVNVNCRLPDDVSGGASPNKRQVTLKKGWQKVVLTGGGASSTRRIMFDFRTASGTGVYNIPKTGCFFAVDDIQLEVGTQATTYVHTTTTSASRSANQVANGQSFTIPVSENGKKISVIQIADKTKNNITITTKAVASRTFTKKYYTIWLGQSNWFYGNIFDPSIHLVSPRVFNFGRRNGDADNVSKSNQIMQYLDPAQWNEAITATANSANAFSRDDMSCAGRTCDLLANFYDRDIIAFTENQGGSSFSANHWTVTTGTLYTSMINRINTFKSTYSNAECLGIFVSLMETDIVSGMSAETFLTNMSNLITNLRSLYGTNIPYVHIGLQSDWTSGSSVVKEQYLSTVSTALNNGTIPKARFVDTSDGSIFKSNDDEILSPDSTDTTHFSANTHYEKLAPAIFDAYLKII